MSVAPSSIWLKSQMGPSFVSPLVCRRLGVSLAVFFFDSMMPCMELTLSTRATMRMLIATR
jgi:hypothetical protein